ncbi:MAG: hypothetical protein PF505_08205 [Vallitaleaceae bacterium]|jgi:hypothetical protein|nr:hypothetical protein [Vallitaleaceae bacterium]
MKIKELFILFFSILTLVSCNKNRFEIQTDDINLDVKIEHFERDLMNVDTANIEQSIADLRSVYGDFFTRYVTNVIMIGSPDSSNFSPRLKAFVSDSMVVEVYKESQLVFADISDIQKEINDAFKYIKYYFPDKKIPRVAMHISGFNQSIVATDEVLSISIDNYLGADYILYKDIVYDYQLYNMTRSKVALDIILGYLMSEFPFDNNGRLLNGILSRGKILYLQSVFMPERNEADLMGYSQDQLEWCVQNEKNMWTTVMENKHLYETSQIICAKYLNPAPFTAYFPDDSPGQAGIWLGLQIVKSYMDNNTDVTLPQLVAENDYQKILEESNYKP